MTQISVSQFRQNLPSFMDRVYAGEEFLVVKNKIPMATVIPVKNEKKITKRKIDPKIFGMWKNRWPKSMSSVDIVNKWREEAWKGNYGD